MREAHPLWFFVVIPTGAIRRIAQRRDLLLASSILPPLQPGPLNHLGFGRCGRCAKRIRFGSLLSSRPERSEGSRSGGTCCWRVRSSHHHNLVPHICPVLADVEDARSASVLVLCCHPDRSDPKDRAVEGPAVGVFRPPITTTGYPKSPPFWQMGARQSHRFLT